MQRQFTLEYWIDDGWYVGKLKEVPGVFSQGESLDELEENIREAYTLIMEEESLGDFSKRLSPSPAGGRGSGRGWKNG